MKRYSEVFLHRHLELEAQAQTRVVTQSQGPLSDQVGRRLLAPGGREEQGAGRERGMQAEAAARGCSGGRKPAHCLPDIGRGLGLNLGPQTPLWHLKVRSDT